YPYPWQPQPKRDTYLLVISIISFIGSGLSLLAGLGFAMLLALFVVLPDSGTLQAGQRFGGMAMVGALAVAGLVGGGFSCYHSMRALFFRKPSAEFKLPWFWIFLALYGIVLVLASTLTINGLAVASVPGALLLIGLAGILPALTFLALGTRRVHYPQKARWPTTWRRFTLALVSGTTSAILLATIFELVLTFILAIGLRLTPFNLSDPNLPVPRDGGALTFLLILVAVIAPLVEESVKPLAVIALIGRIQSAAEAFVLGLACGIGFDLVETTGYISQGYNNWLTVAIQRSTAGLLHGFGAAMVALGWYYLTHRDSINHRILIGLGCIAYAILQHAIWNGSFVLQLLPAPIGPFLESGKIQLGSISFEAFLLVYLCESLLMLVFFLFVTGRLRGRAGQPARPSQLFRPLQKLSLTSKIS
ncbi:MAG: PrsW family intramembrane metalloprotease, partial [Ktedonobacteraceae bacterium]|nr:PrsW family intramembrane metalloprotease [Ktedonobacteraceae bacterium]